MMTALNQWRVFAFATCAGALTCLALGGALISKHLSQQPNLDRVSTVHLFHESCAKNDLETISSMIASDPTLLESNSSSSDARKPLHTAILKNQLGATILLLSRGAR